MFTEQWETVMSDIGDEIEKKNFVSNYSFLCRQNERGESWSRGSIFCLPLKLYNDTFLYRSMAKSFPCQIQKMKVETIHPFKVRSVRFVVVSESLQISLLMLSSSIFCTWCNYFLETVSFCLVFKITFLRCSLSVLSDCGL